jgi:N-6 DNA Methylase
MQNQNLQTLRHTIAQAKLRQPKTIDNPIKLKHGWLLPYVLTADQFLWRRWEHWFDTTRARKIISPIPQIQWQRNQSGFKMLDHCLSQITRYGDWRGWGSWSVFDYFLDWLLFGFGDRTQPELPDEKEEYSGASNRLYQVFNLETLLAYPHDYFGDILAENRFGRESGFFPTPMDVAQLLAEMTFGGEDARTKTVCDPCVGTGRLLLAASNHSYRLYGTDINTTVIKACLVNGYLYAPWLVKPFSFFDAHDKPAQSIKLKQNLLIEV